MVVPSHRSMMMPAFSNSYKYYILILNIILTIKYCNAWSWFIYQGSSSFSRSPLVSAAENGHTDCVSLLLGSGADKEARNYVRIRDPTQRHQYAIAINIIIILFIYIIIIMLLRCIMFICIWYLCYACASWSFVNSWSYAWSWP